jgi:adenine phosphoribosyltransferase
MDRFERDTSKEVSKQASKQASEDASKTRKPALSMDLKRFIRTIPNHPKPGIQFRDITTLLLDPEGLRLAVDGIANRHRDGSVDLVAGIEARGFIFGTAIAYQLGLGFVPIRKPGKLPGETIGRDFDLEYGSDRVEMHIDAIEAGQRILLVDDLIATGGTATAAVELLREVGAEIVECGFVIALPDLGGVERLEKLGCKIHSLCEFAGD